MNRSDHHLARVQLLFAQSKFDLAENELRRWLADAPDDADAHGLLAICLSQLESHQEAERESQQAVHLAPDHAQSHFSRAIVLDGQDRLREAEDSIREAIRIDPYDNRYYGRLASLLFQRGKWREALNAAEEGLSVDPEDIGCLNLRAMAQVKLGLKTDATKTLESALAKSPDDALSHANQGWALLEQNKHQKAMEHFREALRLEPNMEWARVGIIEAMKSRNFVYRQLLRYILWMSKLSPRAQWGVIIGLYIVFRLVQGIARANPAWSPFLMPLIVAYLGFALLTWIADPMFNLLLRIDRFGRYALSRKETVASNIFGTLVLLAVGCIVAGFWLGSATAFLAAGYFGLMIVPIASVFRYREGRPRMIIAAYTLALALAGGTALVLFHVGSEAARGPSMLFLFGFIAFSWFANAVGTASSRR